MIKKIVKNFCISVPGHFKQNSSQNNDGYCAFHGAGFLQVFCISVPGHFKQNSSQNNDGYCAFHGAGFLQAHCRDVLPRSGP